MTALKFLFYTEERFLAWFVVVGHMGAAEEGHVSRDLPSVFPLYSTWKRRAESKFLWLPQHGDCLLPNSVSLQMQWGWNPLFRLLLVNIWRSVYVNIRNCQNPTAGNLTPNTHQDPLSLPKTTNQLPGRPLLKPGSNVSLPSACAYEGWPSEIKHCPVQESPCLEMFLPGADPCFPQTLSSVADCVPRVTCPVLLRATALPK